MIKDFALSTFSPLCHFLSSLRSSDLCQSPIQHHVHRLFTSITHSLSHSPSIHTIRLKVPRHHHTPLPTIITISQLSSHIVPTMSIGPTIFSLASYEHVFQGATIVWREGEDVTDDRLRRMIDSEVELLWLCQGMVSWKLLRILEQLHMCTSLADKLFVYSNK
jgi:hypothetical protein